MERIKTEGLLLNIFQEDLNQNKEHTYISQLTVLTIKSLIPMTDEKAVRIDYRRFVEELKLWRQYRTGENSALLNIQGGVNNEIYWKGRDNSIFARMIPLIIANQEYYIIEEEMIKNILFITGNLKELFESLSIGYLLYLSIEKEEDIVSKLKEYIIGFSQIDFLDKYKKHYKLDIDSYLGNYNVDFERRRIEILTILNGIKQDGYNSLEEIINILDKVEAESIIGNAFYNFLYSFNLDYNIEKFYLNLGEYIIRLRKSRVDPEQLEIKEYILPDIFSFNTGEGFFHSLLRESKVIKKEASNNKLTSLIQTKTGMYLFKR